MFRFLQTDIREQKKYQTRIQTSVEKTVNDLRYEICLKIVWKLKLTFLLSEILLFFFKQKYIFFLETYFFKIPKNLIASTEVSNAALVKLTDWIIKNDHVINCALFFCNW